jgi:membrane-associated phospholipid phosphatase
MNSVLELDLSLFYLINSGWTNEVFDFVLPLVRNRYVWFPLYMSILTWLLIHFGSQKGAILIIGLISCVILSDTISSQVMKKYIGRTRPCNEIAMEDLVLERSICRNSYSFPSSHATNHFAIAAFLILLGGFNRFVRISFWFWAAIISYAQIYVGLHYPLDVIGGALLGVIIARLFYSFLVRFGVL